MTGHNQFLRKARLIIGDNDHGVDLSELQFSFQVRQANLTTPQWTTVRVYNLARQTAQKLKIHEYRHIVIEAGYQQGAYGMIFDGEAIQERVGREDAVDHYFDVIAAAGYSANQSTIKITLAAGSTMLDVAKAAAAAMGQPLISFVTKPLAKMPRGSTMYGMARDFLSKAANTMDAQWYYTMKGIEIVPIGSAKISAGQAKPTAPFPMNAATGMIGWPEQTQDGIKVRCLLNPLLEVGTLLQINNASILRAQPSADIHYVESHPSVNADGLYRVEVVEHRGDTRGNDWFTDIVAIGVDPANYGLTGLVQRGQFS